MPFLDNDGVTRLTEDYLDVFARKEDAILDPSGGLVRTDDGISVDSLTRESNGAISGSIVELTAEGHAEQFSTTGKNLLGVDVTTKTDKGVTLSVDADGWVTLTGTCTESGRITQNSINNGTSLTLEAGSTYTISVEGTHTSHIALYTTTSGGYAGLSAGTNVSTFTIGSNNITVNRHIAVIEEGVTYNDRYRWQLELGSTATEYEPYTGGAPSPSPDYPQEIQVVRGRNLLDEGGRFPYEGSFTDAYFFEMTANNGMLPRIELQAGVTYTLSLDINSSITPFRISAGLGNGSYSKDLIIVGVNVNGRVAVTFVPTSNNIAQYGNVLAIRVPRYNDRIETCTFTITNLQLTLGSTPTPYVPYGHVGMEVRNPDTDELISCTAIPLPERGWVAGLPDGTADTLTLDGAGKCEWELSTSMETFDGSSDESWTSMASAPIQQILLSSSAANGVGVFTHAVRNGSTASAGQFNISSNRLYFNTGFSSADSLRALLEAHPASLLYKLATPVTEDCGYVEDWPTDIPEGATVTIPELDALNVKYFIANDSISQYANQWYERTKAVDIADVEDAVGDLASVTANLVTHDQFYFGYDEVNGKKMISIFKRGDI